MLCEHGQRANDVPKLRPPLTPHIGVSAIEMKMRVNSDRTRVGVVTGNDIGTTVPEKIESFGNRFGIATGFNHDVRAPALGQVGNRILTRTLRFIFQREYDIRAELPSARILGFEITTPADAPE